MVSVQGNEHKEQHGTKRGLNDWKKNEQSKKLGTPIPIHIHSRRIK